MMKFIFILSIISIFSQQSMAARIKFDMNNPEAYIKDYETSLRLKSSAGVGGIVAYNFTGLGVYCSAEALALLGDSVGQWAAAAHEAVTAASEKEKAPKDSTLRAKVNNAELKMKAGYERFALILSDKSSVSYRIVHSNLNCARKFYETKSALGEFIERLSERQPEK